MKNGMQASSGPHSVHGSGDPKLGAAETRCQRTNENSFNGTLLHQYFCNWTPCRACPKGCCEEFECSGLSCNFIRALCCCPCFCGGWRYALSFIITVKFRKTPM